ncbi:hypothetical protein TEA_008961 [Camellia sinensis var. sinensis]|uniref:C2 domain-containing protein n=1 Tax=Camellia sinensis var. sinensis TaxID=542762 RepID=A0A4S4EJ38_CAMSN|nr:hypothetical protein TEA_008961 [Camellia sinensis var. sinensis]
MGACFSDAKGGQMAVGGAQQQTTNSGGVSTTAGGAAHNDAVDFFLRTKGLNALFTQIESDPIAVVYIKKRDGALEELGRTEVIMNSLEPAWIEKINVAYQFEIVQQLVFHVYDVDTRYHNLHVKTLKLKDQEFLGEASCAISEESTPDNIAACLNPVILLHLREEAGEYLEESKLKELVKRYSEFINFPIYLWAIKEVDVEVLEGGNVASSSPASD